MTAAWAKEYRYRKLFGLTHDQYLDEPIGAIDWLLHVDVEYRRAEQRATDAK